MMPLGAPASDFSLKGIDDEIHSLVNYKDAKILVIIFMCNHCPYVQKIWPDMIKYVSDIGSKVQFIGINSNSNPSYSEDSFEKMKEYAKEKSHNFPYLYDENQTVAKAFGAECTPDFFVYNSERKLSYRGSFEGVKDAVAALLQNAEPDQNQKPSMGCSIKWV